MRFCGRPDVEVTIGVLVALWAVLTLIEFALTGPQETGMPALTTQRLELADNLLTYQRGYELYRLDVPAEWRGRTFLELFVELKKTRNATLVAFHPHGREMMVNPPDHAYGPDDEIVVIAADEAKL